MFPPNPNIGDRVALADGRIFEWTGTRWAFVSGGGGGGTSEQTPWRSDIDANEYELINVARIGVEMAPVHSVDVIGDINCTGIYRQDGEPLATGAIASGTAPAAPQDGMLWFDTASHRLLLWLTDRWIDVANPDAPGSLWDSGLTTWDSGATVWDQGVM